MSQRCLLGLGAVLAIGLTAVAAAADDGFRPLAPGVLTVIPPDLSTDDTIQRGDILEVTRGLADRAWKPRRDAVGGTLVERAKGRVYPRDVWCLEFAYKPPRHIDVDVPGPDLTMRRKRVLYLLYRVRNTGGRRTTNQPDDPTVLAREAFEQPVRFLPHFVLESVEGLAHPEGSIHYRGYLDRVIPEAIEPIKRREGIAGRLYDSASMVETDLAPGEERWGVAAWTGVDPRIDFFSIFVRGLTNAVRWRSDPGARMTPDDPPGIGTEHALESLRLDFWRHGDEAAFEEEEVSVGHAGLMERMAIGVRVLEVIGRPELTQASARDGLERLGGRALLQRPVAGLSTSEARSVELAFALSVPDPALVVLYEPWSLTSALEPYAVHRAITMLAERAPVIVLTSSAVGIPGATDHTWVLDSGRLGAQGIEGRRGIDPLGVDGGVGHIHERHGVRRAPGRRHARGARRHRSRCRPRR